MQQLFSECLCAFRNSTFTRYLDRMVAIEPQCLGGEFPIPTTSARTPGRAYHSGHMPVNEAEELRALKQAGFRSPVAAHQLQLRRSLSGAHADCF